VHTDKYTHMYQYQGVNLLKFLTVGHQQKNSTLAILSRMSISFIFLFLFFIQNTRVVKYGGLGVDLARPADQDLYLTQLPSYEYRDLVANWLDCARLLLHLFALGFVIFIIDRFQNVYMLVSALFSLHSIPIAQP
jgi:hypothetical protein